MTSFLDPAINVWHQADPFTCRLGRTRDVPDRRGRVRRRGRHRPVPERRRARLRHHRRHRDATRRRSATGTSTTCGPRPTRPTARCTAHVFDIHEREKMMTIAYYNGGVRVVDLSGLKGISLGDSTLVGGAGMKRDRLLPRHDGRATRGRSRRRRSSRDGRLLRCTATTSRAAWTSTASATSAARSHRHRQVDDAEAGGVTVPVGRPGLGLTQDTAFFCLLPARVARALYIPAMSAEPAIELPSPTSPSPSTSTSPTTSATSATGSTASPPTSSAPRPPSGTRRRRRRGRSSARRRRSASTASRRSRSSTPTPPA